MTDFFHHVYNVYFSTSGRYGFINISLCLLFFYIAFKSNSLVWYSNKESGLIRTFFPKSIYKTWDGLRDIFYFFGITIPIGTLIYIKVGELIRTNIDVGVLRQTGFISIPESSLYLYIITFFYGFLVFFVRDGFAYIQHRLLHENKFLWNFHKTHHSATVLIPLSGYRVHPVEYIIDAFFVTSAIIVADIGFFSLFIYNHSTADAIRYVGILSFSFIYMPIMTLKHHHKLITFGPVIDKIVVSPSYHSIHHSMAQEHINKNYARIFPIFDIVFGSHVPPSSLEKNSIQLGIVDSKNYNSIWKLLFQPFRDIFSKH